MKDYPAIKFAIAFISGILLESAFHIEINFLMYLVFSLIILLLIIFYNKKYQFLFLRNLLLYLLVISSGYFISKVNKDKPILLSPNLYKQKNFSAYGEVDKIELHREYEITFLLNVDSIKIFNKSIRKNVKLLCKIRDGKKKLDSIYSIISPGNIVKLTGTYSKGREMRNPGEYDYNKYLNSKGITGTLTSYSVSDFEIINNNRNYFEDYVFKIRKYLDKEIFGLNNEETAGLIKGLLLGDRTEISYETKAEFVNAGTVHVLAVSGLHVGYIVLICLVLFGRFNVYTKSILTIAGLISFMVISGMAPSVIRATIMGIIILTGFLFNRTTNIFNSLAIAAVIILFFSPSEIFNPGFQLSFAAVASIGLFAPSFQKGISKLQLKNSFIKDILLISAVSVAAQIGTIPLTLAYFGKFSLVSIAANLIVVPAIGIIVGVAFISLAISFISNEAASLFAAANDILTYLLLRFSKWIGNPDFSFLWIRNYSLQDALIFYFLIFALFYFYKKLVSVKAKIILVILIFFNIIFLSSLDDKEFFVKGALNVLMIDVGQGDAILIKFPNDETAIIDAGEASLFFDNGERIIIPLLDYLGIDKINYAFVSHLDADHYGGFISLIEKERIEKVIKPVKDTSSTKDKKFEKFLSDFKIPVSYYERKSFIIGEVKLFYLNDINDKVYSGLSTNDKSGVIKLIYGKTSFLFTGDIESKAERFFSKKYNSFLKANVLKVAHHGSTTSSTPQFILNAKPEISLISAGIANKFGHPSSIILNRLESAGSKILRTDKLGAIFLTSDGDSVSVIDWRNR